MLNGQVAIVTGASRGIGEAIARTLAAAGATVVGTSTSGGGAEAIAKTLSQAGAKGTGKVLVGLSKRVAPQLECVAVTDSAALAAALA